MGDGLLLEAAELAEGCVVVGLLRDALVNSL